MTGVRHFLLALQFFTRVPVTGRLADWVGFSPAMLRASAAHYPGIGLLVGLVAAGVAGALLSLLGPGPFAPLVAAVFCTVATVLLTGALHEDGLADVADGLGGSAERDRALAIMKDSRIGAYGALALVLAHAVSRAWPLLLIRLLPYVGEADGSKAKPLADAIGGGALLVGLAWTAATAAGIAWLQGPAFVAAALLASGVAAWVMARWFARRLGGFTGDCLGATQQVAEIACYLALAVLLAR